MAAAVLAFPPRGGNGFNIPARTKYKRLDITNVCSLNLARSIRESQKAIPEVRDFTFERTPEMLICMALYEAMPTDQRSRALASINEVHMRHCDEPSRIAGNILAAITLAEFSNGRR